VVFILAFLDIAGVIASHYGSSSVSDEIQAIRDQLIEALNIIGTTARKTPIKVRSALLFSYSFLFCANFPLFFTGKGHPQEFV
jgi:nickel-dependent lactate racemase